jgi:hypothetical protein
LPGPTSGGGRSGDEKTEGASGWDWQGHHDEGQAEEKDLAGQVMLFQKLLQILRVKWFFRKR